MKDRDKVLSLFSTRILSVSLNSNYTPPQRLRYIELLLETWSKTVIEELLREYEET